MSRLVRRGTRRLRRLAVSLRNAQAPGAEIEASELFDLDFVRDQLPDTAMRRANAATVCQALATDQALFSISPGPLFDPSFYRDRYADIQGYGAHPFLHFVRHGFYEARWPHPLVDLVHLWSGTQRVGRTLGTPDDLPAAVAAADPHPLISNRFLRETYGEAIDEYRSPLEFYLRAAEPKLKEASVWFSPQDYLRRHPEAGDRERDPLIDFLLSGERLGIDRFLVRGVLSAHGLDPDAHLGPLPWPLDISGYAAFEDLDDPDLSGPLPDRALIVAGVVLYHTDRAELTRFVAALEREVAGLARQAGVSVELQLAVNDRRAQTYRGWLEAIEPAISVAVVDSGSNVGFGRAHNSLMTAAFTAGADHYLGLNPDGFVMKGCLEGLLRLTTALDDSALIEADAFPVGHPKWFDPIGLDTEWVSGAAFLMPRGLHREVGGFDERFFMYCEDVDLSWRVREAGFRTVVCPTARFYHDVAPRLDTVDIEAARAMYLSARLLGHKWGNQDFVREVEDKLLVEGLVRAGEMPRLPDIEPSKSSIPDFSHGLRFALSRYW